VAAGREQTRGERGRKGKSFGLTGRTRDETRRGQDKTVAVNLRELVRTEPYLKRNFYTGPEVTTLQIITQQWSVTLQCSIP
jgi:hypothetical protein